MTEGGQVVLLKSQLMLIFLLFFCRVGFSEQDDEAARWSAIQTLAAALPAVNPNLFSDLDVQQVELDLGGLTICEYETDSVALIDHLIAIFTAGREMTEGGEQYIDSEIDKLTMISWTNRLSLKLSAKSRFTIQMAIGGLQQRSCKILLQQEFIAGAARSVILAAIERLNPNGNNH